MDLEKIILEKSHVDFSKLISYGFTKNDNSYLYSKTFMDGAFKANITIDESGNLYGQVYDTALDEEYQGFRLETSPGSFTGLVRDAYISILNDIKKHCFYTDYFISNQANRITNYIYNKYGTTPEFLWDKFPSYGVFRNHFNDKWYALIANISKSKISNETGDVEIINVKSDEITVKSLINKPGYHEAYHMNKQNWLTITLDDTLTDEEIIKHLDNSYNLINTPEYWLVPANPKYYDIVNCFNDTDTIIWKQSTTIHINDYIYLYVGNPYSCIMYKCLVTKTNIPYEYQDNNVSMNYVMNIKLLKKYHQNDLPLSKLQELGIKTIRGPRKINKSLIDKIIN